MEVILTFRKRRLICRSGDRCDIFSFLLRRMLYRQATIRKEITCLQKAYRGEDGYPRCRQSVRPLGKVNSFIFTRGIRVQGRSIRPPERRLEVKDGVAPV